MKDILINDCCISLITLPIGQLTYKIEWKEKPHRNLFRKNSNETISIDIPNEVMIAETLITQKLWKIIMGTNTSVFLGDDRPVETVSFNEISVFIDRLDKATKVTFGFQQKLNIFMPVRLTSGMKLNKPLTIMCGTRRIVKRKLNL